MKIQLSTSLFTVSFLFSRLRLTQCKSESVINAPVDEDDVGFVFEKMSKEELEAICTNRGFELVKETDSETGKPVEYALQDFIEAAQQCLAIEAEMDEILRNDPALLREIEEEAEKMRLEQRKLENEIAEMQARLDDEEQRTRAGEKVKMAFYNLEEEEDVEEGVVLQKHQNNIYDDDDVEVIDLDIDQPCENSSPEINEENLIVSPNEKSLLHPKDIIREFGDQVRLDFRNIVENACPKPIRDSLTRAISPAIRIVRKAGTNTFDMIKRYTTAILGNNNELDTNLRRQ